MSLENQPLYALSVEEFKKLNKEMVREQLREFHNSKGETVSKSDQDIIFIDDACELTGYSKPTMYSKISKYEIPVLSRGKPLTFSRKELIEWIRKGKPSVVEQIEACEFLKAPRS